ncbi:hypothetical protein [Novosphingobium sp. KN65.2]|uniref:hypothetical protein n=1 Tax=Novosphingobium sp. KN65.2 TaxID=1478134 RepID=UPI001E53CA38|nr:hypothetical protein [Novosphingobium sp. KN65.2]
MTFISTPLCVEQLKKAGFVELEFARQKLGYERRRILMVTDAIASMLSAPSPPFPRTTAAMSFDTFKAGYLVSVGRSEDGAPDFKLLEDLDEVWTFAVRKPKDFQARLLGRFVHKDVFVGTRFYLRSDLGAKSNYHRMASEVAEHWDGETGGIRPLRSDSNSDYLGHVMRDLDNG